MLNLKPHLLKIKNRNNQQSNITESQLNMEEYLKDHNSQHVIVF